MLHLITSKKAVLFASLIFFLSLGVLFSGSATLFFNNLRSLIPQYNKASIANAQGTRIGVSFMRTGSGIGAKPNPGWMWDSTLKPAGVVPCDGASHTLTYTQMPSNSSPLWVVNNKFTIAGDGDDSDITIYFARTRNGVIDVIDKATIRHPKNGFSAAEGGIENPFKVFDIPVKLIANDVLGVVLSCRNVDTSLPPELCTAYPRQYACGGGFVTFGISATFPGLER